MAAIQLVLVYFQVMLLLWSFDDPSLIAEAQAMENPEICPSACGNVSIPYPFGMREGCYCDESLEIHCNSSNIPLLSINGTDLVVTDISVGDSTITVNFPIVFANCDGKERNTVVDLGGSPFVFSSDLNNFIASGCDNLALLIQNQSAVGGCMSICDHERSNNYLLSSCSGINCCQTSIPSYLKVYNVTLEGVNDGKGPGKKQPAKKCRHAYLVDGNWMDNRVYGWSGSIMTSYDIRDMDHVPVVLDWGIELRLLETKNTYSTAPFYLTSSLSLSAHNCLTCAGIGVGFGALFLLIGLWQLYKVFKRRRNERLRERYFKRNGGLLLQEQLSSGEVHVEKVKLFASKELDKATDHYNVNRMLGQGGQGTVYKGMLADGKIIAVKKSKILDEGNLRQFINEVVILSQINHRNVVKLLGCCLETEVPLLVYEFIPNGTLSQLLHSPSDELPFTWEMRLRIATEVAGALSYLHSAASIPIYHRDVKSTNILLDDKYRAKVADFGTSKSVTIDQTHVTTLVQGTFGYLDPEYFQSSQFTDKSDVYSFGVVLVELLTGQKAVSFCRSEDEARSLVTYFLMSIEDNRLSGILDPQVKVQGRKEDIMMVAVLAKNCLSMKGKERPAMKEVTMVLEGIRNSHECQKSAKDFIIPQEIDYDANDFMEVPWHLVSVTADSD
ncbi:wall-associated receptor kinase-like 8 [Populus trichocarpa]|uniref:wall-associated receptor kinase-like 8 n=1 Tax=Populus trichocarpa TaxID=3694 RepID=UPI0022797D88|nr:wall-associated receptor kinase-like 8 [Populus trichocarpa]